MMYESDFSPVLDIGQHLSVITAQGVEKFYECVYVEGLPPSIDLVDDFGSLASLASSNANKVSVLAVEGSARTETDLSEIGQYRMNVLDDIMVTMNLPAAQGKWKTKSTSIRADFNTLDYDPSLKSTEFYVYEDDVPYLNIYNPTNYTLPKTRIQFFGWRIVGRQLAKEPDKYTRVVATGFSR